MLLHRTNVMRRRLGFTLTEILVVIAIMAILAALAAWAVFAMVDTQKRRNTEATIKVVNKVMQSHWQFVVSEAKKETPSPAVLALAGGDASRAQVLWVKFRLMEAFPQNFGEITNPFVYSPDPSGNPYIPVQQGRRYISGYQKKIPSPLSPAHQPATESSACLLIALSVSRGSNVLNADQIGYAVQDLDGDGVNELIDGWRRPLVFTRFDVSPGVQAANPAPAGGRNAKYADPLDSDGTLINSGWYNSLSIYLTPPPTTMRGFVDAKVHAISATNGASANYLIPSIMSAGKDGIVPSADDIYSYNLRLD